MDSNRKNRNIVSLVLSGVKFIVTALTISSLAACAAIGTAVEHKNLTTETKMSDSVFLNPVSQRQKTIYVSVRNTSAKPLDIGSSLKQAIRSRGYRFVSASKAHYWLQVNVLKVGQFSQAAAEKALANGFGGAVAGAATGALVGDTGGSVIGGALLGGLVDTIANHAVKDVRYSVITDVQISERLAKGQTAKTHITSNMTQGSSTQSTTSLSSQSKRMKYRTRVLSTADKVNLDFNDAAPLLRKQLTQSIAGIF